MCKSLLVFNCITMSLSRTVYEMFSVKYWRGFEIWVSGHSRSLKIVLFDSFGRYALLRGCNSMVGARAPNIEQAPNLKKTLT